MELRRYGPTMKIWLSSLISVAIAVLLSLSAAASDIFRDAPPNPK